MEIKEKIITVKVSRFNPEEDTEARYETYKVPYKKGMTVLDVLIYIRENYDGSFAFRYRCRVGYCGSCSVLVDGIPGLACMEEISPNKKQLTIEPLSNFSVIKDLVIDISSVDKRMLKIRPFMERKKTFEGVWPLKKEEIENLEVVTKCMGCLACMEACPVFNEVPQKYPGPLQMVNIARFAFDPRDEGDKVKTALFEGIYNCAFCKKCEEVCPNEILLPEKIIEKLRGKVVEEIGLLPGHKGFLENLDKTGMTLPSLTRTFIEETSEVITPKFVKGKVGLFTGCVANIMEKGSLEATLKILTENGIQVIIPKTQICCGNLKIYGISLKERKKDIIETNIKAFEKYGVEVVLTVCPSCGEFLKKEYFSDQDFLDKKPIFKVLDINEYLLTQIELNTSDFKSLNVRVTYHDPCHLRRGQGIYEEPRRLIKKIPGVNFVEMKDYDKCCGGTLRATSPDIAALLGIKKIRKGVETGADYMITSCPLCVSHLSISRAKAKIKKPKVISILDLLAKAYEK